MGSTLETVVFYFLAAFIYCNVHHDGDYPTYRTLGYLPALRALRHGRHLFFAGLHLPGLCSDNGLCRWYRRSLCILHLLTSGEGDRAEKAKRSKLLAGLITMIAGLAIILTITLKHNFMQTANLAPHEINIHAIGNALLSSDKYGYILPFEAVSILLLACIIGGIIIARKR